MFNTQFSQQDEMDYKGFEIKRLSDGSYCTLDSYGEMLRMDSVEEIIEAIEFDLAYETLTSSTDEE